MSHPYLPVNSCCTDVVINDPCGCTSTLPNTGCGESQCGTNVILSSNILYNGPVLDCIIVEPCDTLNVILQKIDEIICNLLTQINALNIQVNNINGQIININSQVININNTLDVCCNATTTTSTTLPPTTTTTTTVYIPTYCYTLTAIGRVIFYWIDVNGDAQFEDITNTTIYKCAQLDSVGAGGPGLPEIDGGITLCTSDLDCVVITTTTTSTTAAPLCTIWDWASTGDNLSDLEYTNCDNILTVIDQVDIINNSGSICVYPSTIPSWNPVPTTGTHALGTNSIPCVTPTTTTTTTIAPTTTTTTTVVNFEHGFSEGKADNLLACAETVVAITLYTSVPTIVFGTFVYTDPGLTIPFNGGGLFYKNISVNNGIRTSVTGQVNNLFSC